MRITGARLDHFGCLDNLDIDLAPGLNLWHRPNEAGKSTLQQGILALLYGFFQGDRRRPAETELWERFRPWSGEEYRGRLDYVLANGSRYRVERDFSTADIVTRVFDLETGTDVTAQFGLRRHGNVPFARRQLGMGKSVFQACAFLSQGELFGVLGDVGASPQEIGDTIISLADTGRRDLSADAASSRLDKAFREKVGGPQARAAPLPVARRRKEQVEAELGEIDRIREEISGQAADLDATEERARALAGELRRTEYLLRVAQLRDISLRLEQLDALTIQIAQLADDQAHFKDYAEFPSDERDDVLRDWNAVQELAVKLSEEDEGVAEAKSALQELARERASLMREVAELAHVADFPLEKEAAVSQSTQVWRDAQTRAGLVEQRCGQAKAEAEPFLDEHAALAVEVGALAGEELDTLAARLTMRPPAWPVRAIAAAGRAIWAFSRLVWRNLVRAGQWLLERLGWRRRSLESTEEKTARVPLPARTSLDSLTPEQARALLDRHRRFLELDPKVRALQSEEQALEEAKREAEDASTALTNALEGLVPDPSDLRLALGDFTRNVQDRRRLDSIQGGLGQLDARRDLYQLRVDGWDSNKQALDRTERRLERRLGSLGLGVGELGAAVESFKEGCHKRSEYEGIRRRLAAAEDKYAALLGGKSKEELEAAAARLRQEVEGLLREAPSLEGARTTERADALEKTVSQQREELRELELKAEALRSAIETKMADLRPRAELEEELERYQQEAASLEEFGRALVMAREVIQEAMVAAHRDFGPSVGRFLSEGLFLVTAGRYQHATLDPSTFAVTVEVPETGHLQDSRVLSRGTRAAIYLLLRVGLAQHMSSVAEPIPLILDDPLVDLDDVRLDNLLELVLSMTEQVQVLIFSKDNSVAAWFSQHCAGDDRHRIFPMPGPVMPG